MTALLKVLRYGVLAGVLSAAGLQAQQSIPESNPSTYNEPMRQEPVRERGHSFGWLGLLGLAGLAGLMRGARREHGGRDIGGRDMGGR